MREEGPKEPPPAPTPPGPRIKQDPFYLSLLLPSSFLLLPPLFTGELDQESGEPGCAAESARCLALAMPGVIPATLASRSSTGRGSAQRKEVRTRESLADAPWKILETFPSKNVLIFLGCSAVTWNRCLPHFLAPVMHTEVVM